jgi:hypothetical protein
MRITINRMRGSVAHKVGSGQAVFRPGNFGEAQVTMSSNEMEIFGLINKRQD